LERIQTDFEPIAREKNLKLVVMPTSLRVRSDPNLLRRLVQNLVSNAIKYTIDGKVLVGARRRGHQVVIQVMDSGIGIPPSKFRTVFKEFARLDEGARTASGLGLGLSIVDRIARVLNHPVELHSTHGKGTDFRIIMPRDASRLPERVGAAQPVEHSAQSLQGLKVLCVDNEPHILEGMQLLISGWGCEVRCLGSLTDVGALDTRQPPPDLVIADYHLGDGTGVSAILTLRERFMAFIPALIVTADRTPEVRAEVERHGIGLQHKPVRPAALRAYITQISAQKRAAAE
ncbi:MAG: hybrid sensor histidine kinase/response regulator, partial [Shinella sp.]|nr:hybrid sensor histidine kinase/response regulator [Shinella sp.]